MKKGLLLLSLLALAGIILGAKTTITWWINPWRISPPGHPSDKPLTGEEFPKWISEEFMKLHPDVEVKYVLVTNQEYAQKLAAAIATKTQPDFFKGPVWDSRWAKNGLLEPIDEYLSQEDWNDFYTQCLKAGYINGKHYVWPWVYGTNGMGSTMLLYTPDFERAGIDWKKIVNEGWTMEEFLEACKKLTWDEDGDGKADHYAIAFGAKGDMVHNILNFVYAFGGRLANEAESEVILNSPEAIAALQFVLDLIEKHGVAPKGAEALGIYDVIGYFHTHKASIGFGGPYEIGRITRYVNEGRLAEAFYPVIAPFPHLSGRDPVAYARGSGFVVFKQSDPKKREMIFEFLKFITNHENIALLETLNYLTARKSVNETLYQNDQYMNEQVKRYAHIMDNYGIEFFGSEEFPWSQMNAHFVAALEAIFAKTKTPQQALNEFVSEANKILKKAK
ncbi:MULTISPECIES: ABC transporter substrate-binding protein [Pseudothermotoga]|jgi:multiple sugar transport system substrate-binding protein|uniref:Extracellular solute-binding protein family 1 n=1 Tax=Pseudothermotoga lettingae (strain ATCC BAA-301 / DSM 14385 / NBRC 107922 / TMO) TaxID=416591 RepID=A8F8V3_PSELT|nr:MULTISPECIES: sugar ABC transporter substrate-binding protein [Pseudothermotoga]ABV34587.1 extracellular solute-binding protein family 1 [Pseudothermotoga lettingae TMO]MDK2883468.1 multiple sugar transport system substrate-binding protein [Pseudothermotoga sp.]GLI48467.1 ABC transporter substrate-binding protein [Pseudothermotoga lettingae TMO]